MADVINARISAEGDGEQTTEASIAGQYDHLQRCDPLTDIIVAEDSGGALVGYARTTWNDVRDGDAHHFLATRDPWQPVALLGLGAALQESTGQDLRPSDQAAGGCERRRDDSRGV